MNIKIGFCLLFYLTLFQRIEAKVLVMTHSFNRPDFIEWQYKTLKKFLLDDFEFMVFNDANQENYENAINKICVDLQIKSVRIPQAIHQFPYYFPRQEGIGGASAECAETIQYMFDMANSYPGIVAILDSDMFLIRPFSMQKYINDQEIAATAQCRQGATTRIVYFLPNLLIFNMEMLPHKEMLCFNLGTIDDVLVDTGGFTHFYIKKNPSLKWKKIDAERVPFFNINEPLEQLQSSLDNGSDDMKKTKNHVLQSFCKDLNDNLFEENYVDILTKNYFNSHKKLLRLTMDTNLDCEFYAQFSFLHYRAGSNWNAKSSTSILDKTNKIFEVLTEVLESNAGDQQ